MRFSGNDIVKITENSDPNKVHGHDQINIRMLKICVNTICKPNE